MFAQRRTASEAGKAEKRGRRSSLKLLLVERVECLQLTIPYTIPYHIDTYGILIMSIQYL